MEKIAGHVLKSDEVELQGRFHLNVGQVAPGQAKQKFTASTTPQVRIVENHSEFAVIEINCSCGTKSYLRCEYADTLSSADGSRT